MNFLIILLFITTIAFSQDCELPQYYYINSSIENEKQFDSSSLKISELADTGAIPQIPLTNSFNTNYKLEELNTFKVLNQFVLEKELNKEEQSTYFRRVFAKFLIQKGTKAFVKVITKGIDERITKDAEEFFNTKEIRKYKKIAEQVEKVDKFIDKTGPDVLSADNFEIFLGEIEEVINSYKNFIWVNKNNIIYKKIITALASRPRNSTPSIVFISRHDGNFIVNNILRQLRTGVLQFSTSNNERLNIDQDQLRKIYKCSAHLALDVLEENTIGFELNRSGDGLRFSTINYTGDEMRALYTKTNDIEIEMGALSDTKPFPYFDETSKQHLDNTKYPINKFPQEGNTFVPEDFSVVNNKLSPLDFFKTNVNALFSSLTTPKIKDIKFENIRGSNLSELKGDIKIEILNLPFLTSELAQIEFKIDTNGDGIPDCSRSNLSECTESNRDCQVLRCQDVPIIDLKNSDLPKEFKIISFKPDERTEITNQKIPIAQTSGGLYSFENEFDNVFQFNFTGLDLALYKYNNKDNNGNLISIDLSENNQNPTKDVVTISEQDIYSYIRGVGIDKNGLLNLFAAYPGYEFLEYTTSSDCEGENGSLFTKIKQDGSIDTNNRVFLSDDILKAPINQDINNSSLCSNTIINTLDSTEISINGYILKNANITLTEGQGLFKLDSTNIGFNNEPVINGKYILSNSTFNLPIRANQSNIYNVNANFSGTDKDRFISINGTNFNSNSNTNINILDSGISSFTINNSQFNGTNNLNLKEIFMSDRPITSMIISDSTITRSNIENSKINSSTLTDIDVNNSEIFISNITGNSVIIDSETFNSTIENSTINQSTIKSAQVNSSTIDASTIEIGSSINGSTLTSGSFTTFASVTDTTKEGVNYENVEIVNGEEVTEDPIN